MSKITRPILTEVYQRKRLFSLINRLRKQPIIWVSGPPGCGKTTLVSSYLDARKIPCLWYQMDEGDVDPATFFYYMGLAAKKASPRRRKPLPLLTPEYLQGITTFTQRYFEDLYGRLKVPSVLVLDNYQEVPLESSIHEVILNGLSRIPEKMNVILVSRTNPPPVLIRLQANNLLTILGWDDLRLTLEESVGIVRLRSKQKLSRETVKHLNESTDGWAAGLILILEGMRRGIEPQMRGDLTSEEIFDYFGKEIFDKTDKEIQEFFLKTAVLPKMTGKMAEELTGLSSASSILSIRSRNNYFTERRFQNEPIFQYHPLFREFLLSRAKKIFAIETLSLLYSRAARLLEESGQTESAVSLLCEAGDWDGIVGLIMKHAPSLLAQGRNRPLQKWLESLPRDVLEKNPWLLYWMGSCRLPFDPSFARSCFEKGFEKFGTKEDTAGMFLAWSGIVASIIAGFEDFKPLDQWISVLEKMMVFVKGFPSSEIGLRVSFSMFSALMLRQPEHPRIEEWAERALSLAEKCSDLNLQIQTLARLVTYRTFMGDFQKAFLTMNSLRQGVSSQNVSPLSMIHAKHAEAVYFQLTGQHEESLKAVSKGLELSQQAGIHVYENFLLGQGAANAFNLGDFTSAEIFLEKMALPSKALRPWDACFYHHLRTLEALTKANTKQAALHVDLALKFCKGMGNPFSLVQCNLAKAHVLHQLGKDGEANEYLAQSLEMAHKMKSGLWQFYGLFAQALFALDQGEDASCLVFLRKALEMGKEEGYINTFIREPSAMARICTRALDAGIEVEYVGELIRKRNLIPEKPILHVENWPWPIKICTLGRFELLKDGKPIRFSRKAQQKPLSMLKALIAFGGREVREDQIEDALWPEADGDAAHRSFKTNLHRLRQLLGHEEALHLKEGRLTLDSRYCWADVWAFEGLLGEAEAHWKDNQIDRAVKLMEKAIGTYKGPFLRREVEQPWITSMSERLKSKFLGSVMRLGNYWQQVERWEKAVECYQKGLEIDDLAEEFYQGLMTCYHHLGQQTKALSIYNHCKKVLSATLGINPSPKTEAIRRSLLL
jgi:ATP/maltotriose-dependent transcriptional regulator MalT/DNA-binding SARP family transcriptional activator